MSYHLAALPVKRQTFDTSGRVESPVTVANTVVTTQPASVKPYMTQAPDLVAQALDYLQQLGLLSTPTPTQAQFEQAIFSFRAMANIAGGAQGALTVDDIRAMQQILASFNAPAAGDGGLPPPLVTTAQASSKALPAWVRPVGLAALVGFIFLRKKKG